MPEFECLKSDWLLIRELDFRQSIPSSGNGECMYDF